MCAWVRGALAQQCVFVCVARIPGRSRLDTLHLSPWHWSVPQTAQARRRAVSSVKAKELKGKEERDSQESPDFFWCWLAPSPARAPARQMHISVRTHVRCMLLCVVSMAWHVLQDRSAQASLEIRVKRHIAGYKSPASADAVQAWCLCAALCCVRALRTCPALDIATEIDQTRKLPA